MKNSKIKIELELTPNQVLQWNELVARIKDTVVDGPKVGFKNYKKPPREFSEKILDKLPLITVVERVTENVPLFESLQPSVWVGPLELMTILLKEKNR